MVVQLQRGKAQGPPYGAPKHNPYPNRANNLIEGIQCHNPGHTGHADDSAGEEGRPDQILLGVAAGLHHKESAAMMTRKQGPMGLAPREFMHMIVIGENTKLTAALDMIWVRRKGTMKNTKPTT